LGSAAPFLFAWCAVGVSVQSNVSVSWSVVAGDGAVRRKIEAFECALNEEGLGEMNAL